MRCPHCDHELPETYSTRREAYARIHTKINELHIAVMKCIRFIDTYGDTVDGLKRDLTYQYIHKILTTQFNFKLTDTTVSSRLTELRQMDYVRSYRVDGYRSTFNVLTYYGWNYLRGIMQNSNGNKNNLP